MLLPTVLAEDALRFRPVRVELGAELPVVDRAA
jgi:hypothetical protein